jgi:predicted RND superfamily exporter protein
MGYKLANLGGSPPDRYTGVNLRLARLARFLIGHRRSALLLQLLVFAICIWAVMRMHLYDDPNAWPPKDDSYVELNKNIANQFGGANSVSIELTTRKNNIFNREDLHTIKDVTDALYGVKGVIPYAVRSIAALEAKRFEFLGAGTPDEELVITPLMPEYPKNAEDVKKVEWGVKHNPLVNGVLVSKDGKSALILADFRSQSPSGVHLETTEPVAIYHAISAIEQKYRRPTIAIRAAGTPIIIGWVNSDGLKYVFAAFVAFLLMIAGTLWYGFRTISGVLLPLRVALLGALMGFGLYRLFFGNILFSAAALLAPFIVVAAGACHSVQFLTRFFFEEYPRLRNTEEAIVSTFVSRLRPMLVSLLCDVIPFAIMAMIPFENVRALGIVTALGMLSLTFDEFVLMIPALSSVTLREIEKPYFQEATARAASRVDVWLAKTVRGVIDRPAVGVAIIAVCVAVTAVLGSSIVSAPVGQDNSYAIHNYLTKSWNRSDLFNMEQEINRRFGGVYTMTVLITPRAGEKKILESPNVLKAVDKLGVFLRSQRSVGYVADPALYVKTRYAFVHGMNKAYVRVPDTRREIGEGLEAFAAMTPGAYDWLYGEDYNSCVITAYCASTNPIDVNRIIKATVAEAHVLFKGLPVGVGIAGGSLGIAQAFNTNIRYWLVVGAFLGFFGTFVLAVMFIRSVILPALLMIPLILGTVAALGIMVMLGIKINSNTVAALAIASGVGIDSEVYLLYRMREEYERVGDFKEALVQGFVKIRKALLVSNGALILGCWALVPIPLYVGYVGFGMGLVLAVCFVMSAVLSPILWSWMGKRVVIGRAAVALAGPEGFESGMRVGAER